MNADEVVKLRVQQMRNEAQHAADSGTLRIVERAGELVMEPVTFDGELLRLLRNEVAWAQRKRREVRSKVAYFDGCGAEDVTAQRIASELREEELPYLDRLEAGYKAAQRAAREEAAART